MFRSIIFILTLFILGMSITISMLNSEIMEIDLYVKKFLGPIPLFLFISFISGAFLTLFFFLSAYTKHKHENRSLRKTMKAKEDEIDSLRKTPLRDDH